MTLPRGFGSNDRKEKLKEKIRELENKLDFLNSKLDKSVNPYHIHADDVNTIDDVNRLERQVDKKIKNLESGKTPKKGIKVRDILIASIVIVVMGVVIYSIMSYQPEQETSIIPVEKIEPTSPYTAPVIESMSDQCKKAYALGPNEWYKQNCM